MGGGFGGGGGRKGPKQSNGSHKVPNVKLRPQAEKPFLDATESTKSKSKKKKSRKEVDVQGSVEDEEEFGYREDLRPERKPLEGVRICITGITESRAALVTVAKELGAESDKTLSASTTHLIAEAGGTEKYEVALQHNIKVMLPGWIEALASAWRAAEIIDSEKLENNFRMPPLYGLSITVTGFARGTHKDEFCDLLSEQGGAYVSPNLANSLTHCIVASPASPHSQVGMTQKIKAILAQRGKHRLATEIKLVWEGWATEVIAYGGYRAERAEFWAWKEGGTEPTIEETIPKDPTQSEHPGAARDHSFLVGDSRIDASTSMELMEIFGKNDGGVDMQDDQDNDEDIPVPTKAKLKSKQPSNQGVDRLISSFANPQSILPPGLVKPRQSTSTIDRTTELKVAAVKSTRGMEMEMAEETGLRIGKKGKSVIKAMSNSRSTSFVEHQNGKRSIIQRHSRTEDDSALNDSAYFDQTEENTRLNKRSKMASTSKIEVEEEKEDEEFFKGVKIALVDLGDSRAILKNAIEAKGGSIIESEKDADWICVLAFSAPPEYWNSNDPRIVTECWIEQCIFNSKIMEPNELLFDRPSPFECPVPGAETIDAHVSGFDAVATIHIKRLLTKCGGNWSNTFDLARSHLIHVSVDQGEVPAGPKPRRALENGIPVQGLKWLKEFMASAAADRVVEVRRLSKGKGRAIEEDSTKGNLIFSETTEAEAPVLSGCVLFFGPKVENSSELANIAALAGAKIASKFTDQVTHLIHAGNRANEAFKEFKQAKKLDRFIVHPQWIHHSVRNGAKEIEMSFPHMYDPKKSHQLAGIITPSPPNLSRRNSAAAFDVPSPSLSKLDRAHAAASQSSAQVEPIPHREEQISDRNPPAVAPIASSVHLSARDLTSSEKQADVIPPDSPCFIDSLRAAPPSTVKARVYSPIPISDTNQRNSHHFHGNIEDNTGYSPTLEVADPFADLSGISQPQPIPHHTRTSSPSLLSSPKPASVLSSELSEIIPSIVENLVHPVVSLEEKTKEMMMEFQQGLGAEENGRRRNRIGRKKSLVEVVAVPVSPPIFDTQRRPPGIGAFYAATQDEEDSMFITYEDPAGRLARERILAAINGTGEAQEELERGEREKKRLFQEEDSKVESIARKSTRRR